MEKEKLLALRTEEAHPQAVSKTKSKSLRAKPYLDSDIHKKLWLSVSVMSVEKRRENITFH